MKRLSLVFVMWLWFAGQPLYGQCSFSYSVNGASLEVVLVRKWIESWYKPSYGSSAECEQKRALATSRNSSYVTVTTTPCNCAGSSVNNNGNNEWQTPLGSDQGKPFSTSNPSRTVQEWIDEYEQKTQALGFDNVNPFLFPLSGNKGFDQAYNDQQQRYVTRDPATIAYYRGLGPKPIRDKTGGRPGALGGFTIIPSAPRGSMLGNGQRFGVNATGDSEFTGQIASKNQNILSGNFLNSNLNAITEFPNEEHNGDAFCDIGGNTIPLNTQNPSDCLEKGGVFITYGDMQSKIKDWKLKITNNNKVLESLFTPDKNGIIPFDKQIKEWKESGNPEKIEKAEKAEKFYQQYYNSATASNEKQQRFDSKPENKGRLCFDCVTDLKTAADAGTALIEIMGIE